MSARSRTLSRTHRNYPAEIEATIDRLISLHVEASDTYLSLAFFFKDKASVEVAGLIHFFRDLSEEKRHGAHLLLMQSQQSSCDLFSHEQTMPSYQCDGMLDAMETSLALEKHLYQVLLELHALSSSNRDRHLCHFLETRFLEKEMKLMKKLRDNLSTLRQPTSEEVSLSECLLKRITFTGD
ncbi:ferritin light chain-like [Acomys russatus]|uniref:ferritin light chain-like n=1 Tax=Acomys russatus TaxID=60746 RepID=UPI0021E1CF95|nr:ferritin light chain-like [Acomys russatus]